MSALQAPPKPATRPLPPGGKGAPASALRAPRKRLRLYSRLDARFDDRDEDPRASLVNLVDVMLVFACGLLAALAASTQGALGQPRPVDKGQAIERPADGSGQAGAGLDRVGEVFRDPKTGQLILVEPAAAPRRP